MADLVTRAGLAYRLPGAEPADLLQVYYPELCVEILLSSQGQQYDSLIVDEGQDLMREAYVDVFDALLRGGLSGGKWRLFFDPNQDIYRGQDPKAIQRLKNGRPAQFRLSTNCRNTRPIAVTTSMLASTKCDETLVATGPEVEKRWYANPKHQVRQISNHINAWLGSGVRPEEIGVRAFQSVIDICINNATT